MSTKRVSGPRASRAASKKPEVKAAPKPAPKLASATKAKASAARMSLDEAMRALEAAGTAQTRKTYLRHGAREPLFGVSFATLKTLVKRIRADHELALELWSTGNHDARVLAVKVADPARIKPAELDRWAREFGMHGCGIYVAMLAAESAHGSSKARQWLASADDSLRAAGWTLTACLASLDETIPDDVFLQRLAEIERSIHSAPNIERYPMNSALIGIGGRNATLRKAALAAAKRIGRVDIDHGDTDCKTPDAAASIEKTWVHATARDFPSPAAQERAREPMRTRC